MDEEDYYDEFGDYFDAESLTINIPPGLFHLGESLPARGFHIWEYGACECTSCRITDEHVDRQKKQAGLDEIMADAELLESDQVTIGEFNKLMYELGWGLT